MYKKGAKGWLKHWDFILLDMVCLQASFILSYLIRHGMSNPYGALTYRNMAICIELIDIAVIFFYESYKNVLKRGMYREFVVSIKHSLLVFVITTMYLFTVQEGGIYSRTSFFLMMALYMAIGFGMRVAYKAFLRSRMESGLGKRSLLILCHEEDAEKTIEDIVSHNYEMFNIAGAAIIDGEHVGERICGVDVVADKDTALDFVAQQWVDEVFVAYEGQRHYPEELINGLMESGVTVHVSIRRMDNTEGRKQLVERLGNYTVLTLSMNYMSQKQAFMKRAMDIAGGVVGCLITGVLCIFVAPAIYISSPGPIFFSQIRVGENGKRFKMYKFRSMYPDAEERKKDYLSQNRIKDGLMFKLDFDPRVIGNRIVDGKERTGIGEFIRKTSIDEFPQFFNVLRGDMSLVGTRPCLIDEYEAYDLHHRTRMAVKPGITGLWQISGRSEITDFEEVVRLDNQYINDWSLGLDIKIILKTIKKVLDQEGSL